MVEVTGCYWEGRRITGSYWGWGQGYWLLLGQLVGVAGRGRGAYWFLLGRLMGVTGGNWLLLGVWGGCYWFLLGVGVFTGGYWDGL